MNIKHKCCSCGCNVIILGCVLACLLNDHRTSAQSNEDYNNNHDEYLKNILLERQDNTTNEHGEEEEELFADPLIPYEEIMEHFDITKDNKLSPYEFELWYDEVFPDSSEEEGHDDHAHKRRRIEGMGKTTLSRNSVKGIRSFRKRQDDHEDHEDEACPSAEHLFEHFHDGTGYLDEDGIKTIGLSMIVMDIFNECSVVEEEEDDDDSNKVETWEVWLISLGATTFVGCIGLCVLIVIPLARFRLIFDSLIAFGAGALVGDALLHLIPEVLGIHEHDEEEDEHDDSHDEEEEFWDVVGPMCAVCVGIVLFLVLEKTINFLHMHHSHRSPTNETDGDLSSVDLDLIPNGKGKRGKDKNAPSDSDSDNCEGTTCRSSSCSSSSSSSCSSDGDDIESSCSSSSSSSSYEECDECANNGRISKLRMIHSTMYHKAKEGKATLNNKSEVKLHQIEDNLPLNERQKETAKSSTQWILGCIGVTSLRKVKSFGYVNLIADALHNFIDGIAIGAAFSASWGIGIATTLAIILHEIPQEFGDFAILLRSGLSPCIALLLNFSCALIAILGAIIGSAVGTHSDEGTKWILAITAGGFLYIGLADMIPELTHSEEEYKRNHHFFKEKLGFSLIYRFILPAVHVCSFVSGLMVMVILSIIEEEISERID